MRKKTLAQGFLDIALLGANAAQLKRILTVGKENHNFILILVLISMSIALQVGKALQEKSAFLSNHLFQVVQAVLMSITGIFLDMNMKKSHPMQIITNNLLLMSTTLCVGVNVLVSAFDMADLGF